MLPSEARVAESSEKCRMTGPVVASMSHRQAGSPGSCPKARLNDPCSPRAEPCLPVGPCCGAQQLWHLGAAGHGFAGHSTSSPSIPCIALYDFFWTNLFCCEVLLFLFPRWFSTGWRSMRAKAVEGHREHVARISGGSRTSLFQW